jgi:APA family basic amino acid/polyamine antiporter
MDKPHSGPHPRPAKMFSRSKLFRTKSLDQCLSDSERPEYQLKRVLGPFQLILFGIGAIIGAGIFATIGTAAAGDAYRPGAGPALMLSFVITAVVCSFTALCYAEFTSIVPISGSAYTYSYATLGEIIAWIIGWDLIIEYAVGNIAVAISWANYFKTFLKGFNIYVPDWLSMDYRTAAKIVDADGVKVVFRDAPHVFGVPIIFNILAVGIVAIITLILVWGIRESARFNAIMVGIKIVVLTFFIIIGFFWVQPSNWTPFAPNGWAGISAGAAIVFFAYIGFDAVSTVAEETRNPKRDLPIGIIGSLLICTVFYIVVSAVFTGLISNPDLKLKLATEQAEPLTMALQHAAPNLGWAVGIVAFGSVIAHTAVLLIFQMGQPRIFFSMSRDGLLPKTFSQVHKRFRTPYKATILTGVFVAVFAAVASIDEMVDLTNIGTLFAFILVCSGIIVLRKREPDRPRPFKVPSGWTWSGILYAAVGVVVIFIVPASFLVKFIILAVTAAGFAIFRNILFPLLGVLSCLYLIFYLPPTSWLRFAAWLNVGFLIYVAYGSIHSRMMSTDMKKHSPEHLAYTARLGVVLLLIGNAMLFLTRGFDLYQLAFKKITDLSGWSRFTAAMQQTFQTGKWTEMSWFLVIPLALNTLVLCPLIVRRAARAGGFSKKDKETRAAGNTAILVAVLSLIYLAIVIF